MVVLPLFRLGFLSRSLIPASYETSYYLQKSITRFCLYKSLKSSSGREANQHSRTLLFKCYLPAADSKSNCTVKKVKVRVTKVILLQELSCTNKVGVHNLN